MKGSSGDWRVSQRLRYVSYCHAQFVWMILTKEVKLKRCLLDLVRPRTRSLEMIISNENMEEDARNSNGARESSHYRQYSLPLLRHPDRHQGRLSSMRTQVNDKKKSRNKTISAPFLIFVRYMRSLLRN
ncbi:hypothetical protein Bca4012_027705 [Brassica carinata]